MDKLLSVGIEAEKLAWDKGHIRIERDGQARYQYCDNGNGATLATAQEQSDIQDYLVAKWLVADNLANVPSGLELEDGALLDLGGGDWTFAA